MADFYRGRQRGIQVFFLLAIAILLFKALEIQLIDTSYQDRARATAIDKEILYPSRGLILDRNRQLLVNNNAMYDLKCTYKQIDPEMDTTLFCELLDIDVSTFEKKLDKDWRSARYSKSVPFVFMSKISSETYARLQESLYEFPGFSIQLRNVRGYPYPHAAHVLGYLSEVNQDQIEASRGKYARGDYIGATGLEQAYEEELRGKKGVRYLMKDNLGREVGSYKKGDFDTVAVSGVDLITSLDIELQRYGERLMQNKTGSIVAIEPATGEILTMLSAPTYDPNLLTINRNRGEAFSSLLQDSLNPFLDRSVMAKYPPGSIFKTVVSLVGMQEQVVYPNTGFACQGAYFYKGQARGCHGHSYPYDVTVALQHSCNTYYFHTIRHIIDRFSFYDPHQGLDSFNHYVYQFGLGQPLGVDVPNESSGNVPTSKYYDYLYPKAKGGWKSPTVMSIGIGQGEIEMTTVQMANLAAIIANRGWYYPPHLAKQFVGGEVAIPPQYRDKKYVAVAPAYFDPIIDGMEKVVQAGTATVARVRDIAICGKTGTSQNPHGKDHSVFFAFAPRENPQIAIAVYVEHGVWGNRYAAPIASLMIERYLTGSVGEGRRYLENRMLQADLVGQP
ncbi:MAG: penicillin-binding protein 2 [Bacteroidota bacterium]